MDTMMQAIKEAFFSNTLIFNSISLDPPMTIDELFQQANKYSMLDDDLCASLQWTKALAQEDNHWSSNCRTAERSTSHVGNKRRTKYDCGVRRGQLFTPIKLSYSRLLDLIQSNEGFAWPQPMRNDPSQ